MKKMGLFYWTGIKLFTTLLHLEMNVTMNEWTHKIELGIKHWRESWVTPSTI